MRSPRPRRLDRDPSSYVDLPPLPAAPVAVRIDAPRAGDLVRVARPAA